MSQPATTSAPPTTHRSGRQAGRLDLALELIDGGTRAIRSAVQPPLQLSRARYSAQQPREIAFTLVHLGGILSNDTYSLSVALGAGAQANITTAAATQVYRMPHGTARQDIALDLAPGSRLDWLPEPLILFAGAHFTQSTQVRLAPGARLALLDVLVPGRLARGEVHQFEHYENRLEVSGADGRCLLAERALIEPRSASPDAIGILGDTPVLGSLYLLSESLDAERWCTWLHQSHGPELASAILPNQCGLLIRMLGRSPSAVHTRLRELWSFLSQQIGKE